ncbi:hypothetical protein BpHYR1_045523 [Brachionus plicatilis]|uniref:Uncharacterized protein n=1 Tax=Brachionus plicatilis TaxID=10195 RepID=A0A3M7SG79_BRAPC|nr:hypothetical protein BpHYR1_045523 [Brachionus plicatilis]
MHLDLSFNGLRPKRICHLIRKSIELIFLIVLKVLFIINSVQFDKNLKLNIELDFKRSLENNEILVRACNAHVKNILMVIDNAENRN